MKAKNQAVPDEVLSKEFLSWFKTEADVSNFLKQLHAQVLEKMLDGNSCNGSYAKKIQTEHEEAAISISRDRNGQLSR